MKRILLIGLLSIISIACTTEPIDSTVVGTWKLTEYNVAVSNGFDVNNDGVKSINLLEEIECVNNEVLVFEPNGVVSSSSTFNPNVDIFLLDETLEDYSVNVECDSEGLIGFAVNYAQEGEAIFYNNKNASLKGNKLYVVYEDAIDVFNSNASKVVTTKDLTLVYTKQ